MRADEENEKVRATFDPAEAQRTFFGPASVTEAMDLCAGDPGLVAGFCEEFADAFVAFRGHYFGLPRGGNYITAPVHRRWIIAMFRALLEGGQQMVLSPPRHGKTDLLIHFSVWLICVWPNVRIMWVGGSEDLAKIAVSAVRDHLGDNHRLIKDWCPPRGSFKPNNTTSRTWSAGMFEVQTRTVTGMKSPTMVAVGMGGTINSRDCDIIICDDIQELKKILQPTARVNQRTWFTVTLDSRKEEHTAWFVIGSRQHPDDLYHHMLETPDWADTAIVESAHDLACELDPATDSLHTDCMLLPTLRTYRWIRSKYENAAQMGGREAVEMVYLNVVRSAGAVVYTPELIAGAKNPSRAVGLEGLPPGGVLVAGLDPSATGYQSAFLWCFYPETGMQYMVDMDNERGGGIAKAQDQIADWLSRYGVRHWVIEKNLYHGGIRQDPGIASFCAANGIITEDHQTQLNKWDPRMGVTAAVALYREGLVDLPYGDAPSQTKTDIYQRQLIAVADLAPGGRSMRAITDVAMAAWFPQKVYYRLMAQSASVAQVLYRQSFAGYQTATWNDAPWR